MDPVAVGPGWTAAAAAARSAAVEGELLVGPQSSRTKSQKVMSSSLSLSLSLSCSLSVGSSNVAVSGERCSSIGAGWQ